MHISSGGQHLPKEIRLNAANSLSLTWEEAFENIMEADDNCMPLPGPLSPGEFAQIGQVLRSTSALPVAILIQDIGHCGKVDSAFLQASAAAIMEWFPVLTIMRRNTIEAVNLHKAVLDEEIIDDLLQLDGDNNEQQAVPQKRRMEQEQQQAEQKQGKEKRKPSPIGQGGRPAIHR